MLTHTPQLGAQYAHIALQLALASSERILCTTPPCLISRLKFWFSALTVSPSRSKACLCQGFKPSQTDNFFFPHRSRLQKALLSEQLPSNKCERLCHHAKCNIDISMHNPHLILRNCQGQSLNCRFSVSALVTLTHTKYQCAIY